MSNKFKKIVAGIAGIAIVASLTLVGCGTEAVASNEYERFAIDSDANGICGISYVITDNETGVQYLYIDGGYDGGMTVLLDPDGTPHCVDEE